MESERLTVLPPTPRRPGVTSADVARLAGVSRSTVSHILNGQVTRFSEETVERVREAVAQLAYVPSAAGRSLVLGRSDLVVLAVPNTTLTNVQDIIEAIAADLDDVGYSAVVHFDRGGGPAGNLSRLRHLVETLRPAGLVDLGSLSPADLDALEEQGCPVLSPRPRNVHGVDEGNFAIARAQAEHLIERGFPELAYAYLDDRRDDPFGRMRATVVADVCAEAGLPEPARISVPLRAADAQTAVCDLLRTRGRPVGIACSNDEVAVAVTFAALALRAAVPGDVGVVGVGGGSVGQLVEPRLSTVTFDVRTSVSSIRQAIRQALGGSQEPAVNDFDDTFSVLQGATT
ncbi:LacI family DNA-binding transcriptional regulator [Blastococcus sp. URHD0036]|uniref:LacI family DNA-binding transcriptional regulator n=1 Tax=Blastococcus sp. URHD0036 TaxID=1380356 RepID=UPI00068E43F7|nr:LacI family DNA-binding transcriptional regulator [Blastococcus sp. URHD0036]